MENNIKSTNEYLKTINQINYFINDQNISYKLIKGETVKLKTIADFYLIPFNIDSFIRSMYLGNIDDYKKTIFKKDLKNIKTHNDLYEYIKYFINFIKNLHIENKQIEIKQKNISIKHRDSINLGNEIILVIDFINTLTKKYNFKIGKILTNSNSYAGSYPYSRINQPSSNQQKNTFSTENLNVADISSIKIELEGEIDEQKFINFKKSNNETLVQNIEAYFNSQGYKEKLSLIKNINHEIFDGILRDYFEQYKYLQEKYWKDCNDEEYIKKQLFSNYKKANRIANSFDIHHKLKREYILKNKEFFILQQWNLYLCLVIELWNYYYYSNKNLEKEMEKDK